MDESYADQKNLSNFYVSKATSPLLSATPFNYPQSHHAVLNNFRSDYEDFSFFQDLSLNTKATTSKSLISNLDDLTSLKTKSSSPSFDRNFTTESSDGFKVLNSNSLEVNPTNQNVSRFSNPIALRRTARSSMVTYQAFQKVFKLRYDEGRAHVRVSDFSNSSVTQPYTTEQRVKYDRMLGKNKMKHFNTNFNISKTLPVINDLAGLTNSLNFYFYEFPFLDGVTNDPTRHV
jgi:hypothetical protein